MSLAIVCYSVPLIPEIILQVYLNLINQKLYYHFLSLVMIEQTDFEEKCSFLSPDNSIVLIHGTLF